MKEQDIYTLQSAVELDRVHNEGKLFRALKGSQITKEEMISSILSIVQKKNAQNETQKLLSNIADSNGVIVGDYWDKEEPTIKDRVLNGLIFDRDGNFNMEHIKKFGSGLLVVVAIVFASGAYGYKYLKNMFKNTSKKKSIINREEIEELLQRDEDLERIREQYKKKLELLNQLLDDENLSDEHREKYEKEKEDTEQLLNNNDNYVGGIVEDQ